MKKILVILVSLSVIAFVSCKKEKENSSSESKTEIKTETNVDVSSKTDESEPYAGIDKNKVNEPGEGIGGPVVTGELDLSNEDTAILKEANKYSTFIEHGELDKKNNIFFLVYNSTNSETNANESFTIYFDAEMNGEKAKLDWNVDKNTSFPDWYVMAYDKVIRKMDKNDFEKLQKSYPNVYIIFNDVFYGNVDLY